MTDGRLYVSLEALIAWRSGLGGGVNMELQPCAFISSASFPPHRTTLSIHSSRALPDFNFTRNQQNKQTSGRKGGEGEGWGVVALQGRGLQRMRFSLWLSLYRQKELRRKPCEETLRQLIGAVECRIMGGSMHVRARACLPADLSDLELQHPRLSSRGRRMSLCLRPVEDAQEGEVVCTEAPGSNQYRSKEITSMTLYG